MNEGTHFRQQCNTMKFSKVRSPADGEEDFPDKENNQVSDIIITSGSGTDKKETMNGSLSSEDCTPPCFRWAQNLHNLLNDSDGIELFKRFLKQEGDKSISLDFWFAANGVRDQHDNEIRKQCSRIISSRFLPKIPDISSETRSEIMQRIAKEKVDNTLFDKAQKEVEAVIMRTIYPNFLRSDVYMQYIQQIQNSHNNNATCHIPEQDGSSTVPVDSGAEKSSSNSRGSRERLDVLQTVFEDSELQISNSNKVSVSRKWLQCSKSWDSDKLARFKPESQAGHYLKSYTPGYNTNCYTKYAAYLPPSAQDSEVQSISSGAQTDDTMSIVSSSTDRDMEFHRKSHPKQFFDKHGRLVKPGGSYNRDSLPLFNIIPRTQRQPPKIDQTPEEFAAVLTEKLNKYIESENIKEELNERMQDGPKCYSESLPKAEQPSNAANPASILSLATKLQSQNDTAQSILDDHVSRVFFDSTHQTPSPSPGCLTPSSTQVAQELSKKLEIINVAPCSSQSNSLSCTTAYRQYAGSYGDNNRHRRDPDKFSLDSGTEFDCDYIHSAAELNRHRSHHHSRHSLDSLENFGRYPRDSSRRSGNKKSTSFGDCSSCFDSGISGITGASISISQEKTLLERKRYFEAERESCYQKKSPPTSISPILGSKKSIICNNCHNGQSDSCSNHWHGSAAGNCSSMVETFCFRNSYGNHSAQSDCSPVVMDPDCHLVNTKKGYDYVKQKLKPFSNTRERPSDTTRSKTMSKSYDVPEDYTLQRKLARKSYPSGALVQHQPEDMTRVVYIYGKGSIPFVCYIPGKCILLKQFKSLLCKKGNFRYFFRKKDEDLGIVNEEIYDDSKVLPILEGKILCQIEQME